MKKYSCLHYHICLNSYSLLCNDSKCRLEKQNKQVGDSTRLEKVRQAIDCYKADLGIESFLDLNKKQVDKKCKL